MGHRAGERGVLGFQQIVRMTVHVDHFIARRLAGQPLHALEQPTEYAQALARPGHHVIREFDRPAVVRAEQEITQQIGAVLVDQLARADDVADRAGHLLVSPLAG